VIEQRMAELFDVTFNLADKPMSRDAELVEAMHACPCAAAHRDRHGLMPN
jgi:hypothetical protein